MVWRNMEFGKLSATSIRFCRVFCACSFTYYNGICVGALHFGRTQKRRTAIDIRIAWRNRGSILWLVHVLIILVDPKGLGQELEMMSTHHFSSRALLAIPPSTSSLWSHIKFTPSREFLRDPDARFRLLTKHRLRLPPKRKDSAQALSFRRWWTLQDSVKSSK